jgi:tetratricopeptide (TPR) repeat protein
MSDEPLPVKAPKARPVPKPPSKEEKDEVLRVIIGMIDQFCREHLNDEYAILCRKLAEKLARKRPSPLLHGSPNTWASGIVRTIGWVNFLGDPSQTPHMKSADIDRGFGISEATGQAKSMAIRKLLRLQRFDPEWTLPSKLDDNPLAWLVEVNGFPVDVRSMPREIQEEAFRKGLIPYLPDEAMADAEADDQPVDDPQTDISRTSAADAAVLVGELHLRQGEYAKAIEAFTRAIENGPTADAYQGRAKAYRGLAEMDDQKAREHAGQEVRPGLPEGAS